MALERVTFREGQVLHAADLNDAGAYLLSLRRRHDAGPHRWGIVGGLALETEPGGFVVNPGFAWDGYGRSLNLEEEIFRPWQVPAAGPGSPSVDLFDHLNSPAVDVWLLHDRRPADPAGRCRDLEPTRWLETTRLCYTPAPAWEARPDFDPRQPWGVSSAALQFRPHQDPADDPERLWPVYLGTLLRGDGEHRVDTRRRPYASLVAAQMVSVSRRTPAQDPRAAAPAPPVPRAELLLEGERPSPQPRRFAVRVADGNGHPVERLAVERPGRVTLRGNTTLVSQRPIGDRELASDWILAVPDPIFGAEDVCDPGAVACRLGDFEFADRPTQQLLHLLQGAGTAERAPQAAALGLNLLLLEPALHQAPVFARVNLRAETQRLIAATRPPGVEGTHPFSMGHHGETVAPAGEIRNAAVRQLVESEALAGLFETPAAEWRFPTEALWQEISREAFRVISEQLQKAAPLQVTRNRLLLEDLYGPALCAREKRAFTLGFAPLAAVPEAARPWSLYRTDVPPDEETGEPAHQQLRIEFNEFGEPKHPERSQFVVGYYDAGAGAFHPCLSIDERCTLRLAGDLTVEGDVIQRPPPATGPGAPGTGGGAGAGELTQPSFEEAVASQPEAPSTLSVQIPNFSPATGTDWPYDVQVENTGAEGLRWILVLETFAIDGGDPSDTRVAGGLAQLDAGASAVVPVTHASPLPGGASQVAIQLTVMAFTPTSAVMYQGADRTVTTS
jgi:hypothetical protein